jgi:predicted glycogen debranching enzyme
VLVNGLEAWVETPAGRYAISSQSYAPDVIHPDGASRIEEFWADPWPAWRFRLEDGTRIEQEVFFSRKAASCVVAWKLAEEQPEAILSVRLLLSGRDYHALHHENPAFRFEPVATGRCTVWQPYEGLPYVAALSNGLYEHDPTWYRNFQYDEERSRGLDFTEDLASPGVFRFDLSRGEAVLFLSTSPPESTEDPAVLARRMRSIERRRRSAAGPRLERAAEDYVVRRGKGRTIVAGYPWFTDWGRDTFIALRGLCLATGRIDEAREILMEWSGSVSEGMLPNRFPDRGDQPEYNSVDASLWYVVAVHDYFVACERLNRRVAVEDRKALRGAIESILDGYARGTRYAIHADSDGLLAAGVPGVQLTWMDAKVGDWVVTPRIGKPVEVQALWINALRIGSTFSPNWSAAEGRARSTFAERFWNESGGCLYDVVDCDHIPGTLDPRVRPNQIFAVGGLPFALLEDERARRIVDTVQDRLWTSVGLRSLSPDDPQYVGRYEGGVHERDGAYHQGTVWPWLAGAFIEAWVRVRGATAAARRQARTNFYEPFLASGGQAGIGHLPEIADGDPPHTSRGCPFQAWSVGEALRLERTILREM